MIKAKFTIDSADDADMVATACAAIADAYRKKIPPPAIGAAPVMVVEPVMAEPTPEPVKVAPVVATEPTLEPKPIKRKGKEQPKDGASTPLAAPRTMVGKRGVLWGRELLAKYNVAGLTELTDEQIAQVLADVA